MYFAFAVIYIVLCVVFIADVLRNRALTGAGKALWILALVFIPVCSPGSSMGSFACGRAAVSSVFEFRP
ncbi:MAG: hypothetical protein ABI783_05630 [Actinomycetota bacterium]